MTALPLLFVRDAASRGASSALTDEKRLVTVWRGVRTPSLLWAAADRTTRQHARVRAAVGVRRDGVLVGESAALLHGIPLVDGLDERVHVLSRTTVGSRSRHGLVERRFAVGPELAEIDGVVVASLVDTVVDVARHSGFRRGVAAVDHVLHAEAVRGRDPEHLRAALQFRLGCFAGGRGVRTAAESIAFAHPAAESPLESVSRVEMALAGFPEPRLQHSWTLLDGSTAVTDFDWPEHGLVGEADGRAKYSLTQGGEADAVLREKRRENALRLLGPRVVRWEWEDAFTSTPLVALLRAAGLPQQHARSRYPRGHYVR